MRVGRYLGILLAFATTLVCAIVTGKVVADYYGHYSFKKQRERLTDIVLKEMGTIARGDTLQEFPLETIGTMNATTKSDQIRGKDRRLMLFLESSCGACQAQMRELNNLERDDELLRQIVVVLSEGREEAIEFARRHDVSCRVTWDSAGNYRSNYRITDVPFGLVLDESNSIMDMTVGVLTTNEILDQLR